MAREYWKLSSAGREYVKALLKDLRWDSLGKRELAETLKENNFTIDRNTLRKFLDPDSTHSGNKSTLVDLMNALGSTEDPTTKEFAKQYFEQVEREEELDVSIIETSVIPDYSRELDTPFQPIKGRIENPKQFFNRETELRNIFELLNAGSGVELLGDRQMGKSSILFQVERLAATMLRAKRKPIYFNLQEVHTEEEFYESFCGKLGIETCMGYGFFRAIQDKKLLLLLDEAEKMSWDGFTRQIREQLRCLAEGENAPLRLVVAARTSLDELFPDSNEQGMTSPFQGICTRVELKPWQKETVQRFVVTRLENTGISFSETDLEKLWQESQGHPQKLMIACFDLYRQYLENL